MQLGHRHPAARPRKEAQPRHRVQEAGQPRHCVEPRDTGDDGRHGHQLRRGTARKPSHAARHRAYGHRTFRSGHPLCGSISVNCAIPSVFACHRVKK